MTTSLVLLWAFIGFISGLGLMLIYYDEHEEVIKKIEKVKTIVAFICFSILSSATGIFTFMYLAYRTFFEKQKQK